MPGLVVSVRDVAEVRPVIEAGANIIDIKEPALGSLGRAPSAVREAILDTVAGQVSVSAALGELRDDIAEPIDVSRLAFVKYGLSECRDLDWQERLRQVRTRIEQDSTCRLVLAAYADWRRAGSPSLRDVCHHAIMERVSILLIDTWGKDGSTLVDWVSVGEVTELIEHCHASGVQVALAGALGARQMSVLRPTSPDWFAVRGAVCARGERKAAIDSALVRCLVEMIQ